jgi:Ca2+-binding RTX toxin-like protein
VGRGLLAICAAALALPGSAHAAALRADTIKTDPKSTPFTVFYFTGLQGEANDLTVTREGRSWTFTDRAAPIRIDRGCTLVMPHVARCEADWGQVRLEDGDDRARAPRQQPPAAVFGGSGDDVLDGEGHLDGEEGDDVLRGGPGKDSLALGPGRDRAFGRGGDDSFSDGAFEAERDEVDGGAGRDVVHYPGRRVTVDLRRDSGGAPGEDDVFAAVEGASGKGLVIGDGGPNTLSGRGTVIGGGGDDALAGSGGRDRLDAGPGDDAVYLGPVGIAPFPPPDRVRCGPGRDYAEDPPPTALVPADCEGVSYYGGGGAVATLPGRRVPGPGEPLLETRTGDCLDSPEGPCKGKVAVFLVARTRAGLPPVRGAEIARDAGRFANGKGRLTPVLSRAGRRATTRSGCVRAVARFDGLGDYVRSEFMFRFGPRCPIPAPLDP